MLNLKIITLTSKLDWNLNHGLRNFTRLVTEKIEAYSTKLYCKYAYLVGTYLLYMCNILCGTPWIVLQIKSTLHTILIIQSFTARWRHSSGVVRVGNLRLPFHNPIVKCDRWSQRQFQYLTRFTITCSFLSVGGFRVASYLATKYSLCYLVPLITINQGASLAPVVPWENEQSDQGSLW